MTKSIILIFLCLPIFDKVNPTKCKGLREGVFKLESAEHGLFTIIRTKDKQTERVSRTGLVSEFDIKWTSDCTYLLFNRRVVEGKDNLPPDFKADTLNNEIFDIENNQHKVRTYIKAYDFTIVSTLVKIDTTILTR